MKIFHFFLIFIIAACGTASAASMSIVPSSQVVSPGQTFTVAVMVDPAGTAIAGAQFNFSFDSSKVTANSVTEGNFLNQNGADTFFYSGSIDNSAGIISYVYGAITTSGANVSTQGTFAIISMTANSAGTSSLTLSNVIVGNPAGSAIPTSINNGNVSIGSTSQTKVNITPSSQTVSPGQTFTVGIMVDPAGKATAGVQFNLSFDRSIATINSVSEGVFLNQNGASTYFNNGTINNAAGTVTDVYGVITTPGASVTMPAAFASISMTAVSGGVSPLNLSNVIVSNISGAAVQTIIINGSVLSLQTSVCGDVNCDGNVDISDVTDLLYFVGYPGQYTLCNMWAADVNGDGNVDISDVTDLLYFVGYPGQYSLSCRIN